MSKEVHPIYLPIHRYFNYELFENSWSYRSFCFIKRPMLKAAANNSERIICSISLPPSFLLINVPKNKLSQSHWNYTTGYYYYMSSGYYMSQQNRQILLRSANLLLGTPRKRRRWRDSCLFDWIKISFIIENIW